MAIAANTFGKAADCMNSLHVRRDFRASTIYWAPNENSDSNLIPVGHLLGPPLSGSGSLRVWPLLCLALMWQSYRLPPPRPFLTIDSALAKHVGSVFLNVNPNEFV